MTRIKDDHRRIILPSIDNIKHETFELERYENSGHGYNWELWCMYISPPRKWWDDGDTSAPIRLVDMEARHTHTHTRFVLSYILRKGFDSSKLSYFQILFKKKKNAKK